MADVPEDLVARRVEQAVQRDGQLAGAEVRAEVAADLPDRVDDVLADLLRELDELVVVQSLQVLGARDAVEQALRVVFAAGHQAFLACMKSVISSRSRGSAGSTRRASSSAARALSCELAASSRARSSPKTLT